MSANLPALVDALAELTEREVLAARALEGEQLRKLDQERADRLFELQITLQDRPALAPTARDQLRRSVTRLRAAEDRLSRVARTVIGVLAALRTPSEAPTYARTGTLRG